MDSVSGLISLNPRASSSRLVSTTPTIFAGSIVMIGEPIRSEGL
jgi:hypothetical protein